MSEYQHKTWRALGPENPPPDMWSFIPQEDVNKTSVRLKCKLMEMHGGRSFRMTTAYGGVWLEGWRTYLTDEQMALVEFNPPLTDATKVMYP